MSQPPRCQRLLWRRRGKTFFKLSFVTVAFFASIQFYQLFNVTTEQNELLPNDAPTIVSDDKAQTRTGERKSGYFYAQEISRQPKAKEETLPPPPPLVVSHEEQCSFCEGEGGTANLDLKVPNTGGNTCRSIKLMAAGYVNGSDTCAIIQKEEIVCCPGDESSGNDLKEVGDAPTHGHGALEKDVIPTKQIENSITSSVSLEAAQASVETLKQMYTTMCNGTDVDPPKWWMYHYECPREPFLTKDAYYIIGNMSRSENGVFVPRMQIENIAWYGQMLDFYVSQLFFLHPKPLLRGRFLEIGAYTGLEFTNTLFFEHYLQWEGWLFEPTTCYDLCRKNRPAATTKVFQQGLCPNATEFEFKAFGNECKSRVTKCVPLTDMDEDWYLGFDFISIDVEGNELDVLKSIDFRRVPVKVLVIEWRNKDGDSRADYLDKFGYVRLANLVIYKELDRSDEVYYRPDLIQPHIFKSTV